MNYTATMAEEASAETPGAGGVADDGAFTAPSPPEANKSLHSEKLASGNSVTPVQPAEACGAVTAPSEGTGDRCYEEFFDICTPVINAMATSEAETERHLYDVLEHVANIERNWQFGLGDFCRVAKLPFTKATIASPYQAIIRGTWLKAGRKIDVKVASNQGLALQFAMGKCGDPARVAEFLRGNGGIQGCLKAHRAEKKCQKAARAEAAGADQGELCVSATATETETATATVPVTVSGVPSGFKGMCTVRIDETGRGEFVAPARPTLVPEASQTSLPQSSGGSEDAGSDDTPSVDEPEKDRLPRRILAVPDADDGIEPPAEPAAAEEVPAAAQG